MARVDPEGSGSDLDRIRQILIGPRIDELQSRLSSADEAMSHTEQGLASLTTAVQSLVARLERQERLQSGLGRLLGEAARLLEADAAPEVHAADAPRSEER